MANELIINLKPSKERMLLMANEGYTTATDFADYLVKEKKLSFRESYGIASNLVNYAEKNNKSLDQLTIVELKKFYKNLDNKVMKVFNVKNSMNSKNSYGGTSSNNVRKMLRKYKKEIKS
jgi:argininosuccinate lyase